MRGERRRGDWSKSRIECRSREAKSGTSSTPTGSTRSPFFPFHPLCLLVILSIFLVAVQWSAFSAPGSSTPPPGPIDNGRLLENGVPKKGLNRGSDYRGLSREVWDILYDMYGGGPVIIRSTVSIYSSGGDTPVGRGCFYLPKFFQYLTIFLQKGSESRPPKDSSPAPPPPPVPTCTTDDLLPASANTPAAALETIGSEDPEQSAAVQETKEPDQTESTPGPNSMPDQSTTLENGAAESESSNTAAAETAEGPTESNDSSITNVE